MVINLGIKIKGITVPALLITFDEKLSFEENLKELEEKLSSAFFKSSLAILDLNGLNLSDEEKKTVEDILKKHNTELLSYRLGKEKKEERKYQNKNLKIVNKTVRSGQKIEFKGDILILGDVNPDAYIVASGNIIVMGALRGVAHAGADGNEDAQIVALKLIPQQLRIAHYYTRSPDDEKIELPEYPERAYVKDNKIYVERI